jgi:hypothetical protein
MDDPQSGDEIHAQIGDNASGFLIGNQNTQTINQHFYNQLPLTNSATSTK